MNSDNIFNQKTIEKFENISSKLYNIKYCLEFYLDYIENETDAPLNVICTGLIIKEYFNNTKNEYNRLEEDLGILS